MIYDKLLTPIHQIIVRAEALTEGEQGILNARMHEDITSILDSALLHINEFDQFWNYIDQGDFQSIAQIADQTLSPLNAMTGYCWFLLEGMDGDLSPEQVNTVTEMRDYADYLLTQFHNLWDYARITSGSAIWIKPLYFDIQSRIIERLECYGKFDFEFERGLPWVYADEIYVRQCVTNLLDNALRFAPRAEISLRAFAEHDQMFVTIEDSGPGIAPEHQYRIFDAFWQARPTANGLGLGLYLVKSRAELIGGSIHVESTPGRGTAFTLTIPTSAP